MNKANFTSDRVTGFQCENGKQQSIFWDGKTPGLGLRVTSAGAKSYIFETRLHGKTLRLTIGDFRTWTIGKAQAEATRLKSLTDQGIDPRQQRDDQRVKSEADRTEKKRRELTVGDVWPSYLLARKSKWGDRHYLDHVQLASTGGEHKKRGAGKTSPGPLAALMPLPFSELTGERIGEWLSIEAGKRPTQAALAYRLLSVFVNWCDSQTSLAGLVPAGACKSRQVKDVIPSKNTKDGDCLQREQLAPWFKSVLRMDNVVQSVYLQALLLTGARRRELASLCWVDVDFKWNSLTIRDKVEGERTIPLTPYLAHLLTDLKRRNDAPPNLRQLRKLEQAGEKWEPSLWVFSSPSSANGQLAEPTPGHKRALASAGLPDLTLHALRRSFGTLAEWCEVPAGVVAQIMGHKPSAIAEKHYRRRPLDLLRMWHVKIEAWILAEAGIEFVPAKDGLRVAAVA